MSLVRRAACALLIVGAAGPAHAATISLTYDFTASGFPVGAPVDPVTGSFAVTFDNTADTFGSTTGVSITDLNISLGPEPSWSYLEAVDVLIIGGAPGVLFPGTDNFYLSIHNASTTPTFDHLAYVQGAGDGSFDVFLTRTGTLTPTDVAAVPEPTTLTLLGIGVVGLSARRWRQGR